MSQGEKTKILKSVRRKIGNVILVIIAIYLLYGLYLTKKSTIKMVERGRGMSPTVEKGDLVIVKRLPLSQIPSQLKKGDMVVYHFPFSGHQARKIGLSRIVAVEGESVIIKSDHLYINEMLVSNPKPFIKYIPKGRFYEKEKKPILIPSGHFFVLGDNSEESYDSRYWGFLSAHDIVGKVIKVKKKS